MAIKINKNFLKTSHYITDLKLCSVRLIDNEKFPWIILVPKRNKVTDITNLNSKDQITLIKEIVFCSNVMKKIFKTTKLNVEKIGNIVPQLHIHIKIYLLQLIKISQKFCLFYFYQFCELCVLQFLP